MKALAEQFEIDFARLESERALFEQWQRNREADAHNWTEEAMAMVWRFGRSDWDAWRLGRQIDAVKQEDRVWEKYP